MNQFGKNIRFSLFGESHKPLMGITIDGLPSGLKINTELIDHNLFLRRGSDLTTNRKEPDEYEIISGYHNLHTTGAPLTIIVKNKTYNDSDYDLKIRPSHQDLTHFRKFNGFNDPLGGGMNSGRITVLFVILGSICQMILKDKVKVISKIHRLGNIYDLDVDTNNQHSFELIDDCFQVISSSKKQEMIKLINDTKKAGDSLSGEIKTFIFGIHEELGEPFMDSFESLISHLLFAVPGVKGVIFGDYDQKITVGSKQIDEMEIISDKLQFLSNHEGGINGGLTNQNTVSFTTIVKAPVSINKKLKTVNLITHSNDFIRTVGQHDNQILTRIIPVINSLMYFVVLDMQMENKKWKN